MFTFVTGDIASAVANGRALPSGRNYLYATRVNRRDCRRQHDPERSTFDALLGDLFGNRVVELGGVNHRIFARPLAMYNRHDCDQL
jgi:hypothetical protein